LTASVCGINASRRLANSVLFAMVQFLSSSFSSIKYSVVIDKLVGAGRLEPPFPV
jgi:hypothetical protein